MNIEIKELNDEAVWDAFVLKYNPWSLFQSFAWSLLQEKLHVGVIRWGIYDKEQLVGVCAIYIIKARRGTFLHLRHGPIFGSMYIKAYWECLLKNLKAIAARHGAWFIRMSPLVEENGHNLQFLKDLGFTPSPIHRMDGEICWVLDIDKPEVELISSMRKTTRYSIRQAEKLGVKVYQSEDLDPFFELYEATYTRHGFVPHIGIKEEFELFRKTDQVVLFYASYQGKIISSALILFFGPQAIYHHSASLQSKIPASHLLQWQAIREAKKRGKQVYNFWGIAPFDNPNHPWKGITLFKQGFGGRQKEFIHAHDLALSPFYAISYTIEIVRKIRRGY